MVDKDRDTGVPGFRIYADDTSPLAGDPPRKGGGEPDWAVDSALPEFRRWEDDDAAGPEPLPPLRVGTPRPQASARGRSRVFGTLAVAVVACAIGVGVGLAWPELRDRFPTPRPAEPPRAVAPQAAVAPEVTDTPALEAARPAPPARLPSVAEREAPSETVGPRPPAPTVERAEALSADAAPARDASATIVTPAPSSGACAEAGTLGGQLGCEDPAVEAAQRRMESAYRLALDAGASPERLSADQTRWLALRDRAAQSSRGALITAYQLRIQELAASARTPD